MRKDKWAFRKVYDLPWPWSTWLWFELYSWFHRGASPWPELPKRVADNVIRVNIGLIPTAKYEDTKASLTTFPLGSDYLFIWHDKPLAELLGRGLLDALKQRSTELKNGSQVALTTRE